MITDDDELSELAAWVQANGGYLSGLEVRSVPGEGRGIFATRDLLLGEDIVQLPRRVLMTGDVARSAPHVAAVLDDADADELSAALGEFAASDPDTTAIILFLLSARARRDMRGPGAARLSCPAAGVDWSLWIDSLPETFETPTTVAEERAKRTLAGSTLLDVADRLRDELRVLYDQFIVPFAVRKYPDAYPPASTTYDSFLWAFAVTESRAFGLKAQFDFEEVDSSCARELESEPELSVLTPYADMMNHACNPADASVVVKTWHPKGKERSADIQGFRMIIQAPRVRCGQQLFISYGRLDNAHLLLHYGFACESNPEDGIPICLEDADDAESSLYQKKLLLEGMACSGMLTREFLLTAADPLPAGLLASLRLLLMTEEDASGVTWKTDFFAKLNPRNESAVYDYLETLIKRFDVEGYEPQTGNDTRSMYEDFSDMYMQQVITIATRAYERIRLGREVIAARWS